MTSRCLALLAGMLALGLGGPAAAQVPMMGNLPTFDTAPAAPPPGGAPQGAPMGPPPGAQSAAPGPQGQEPPCYRDFLPLREDAEKRGKLIQAAADRKAPRPQVCQLFKNFAVSEAKVVKFVTDNQSQCKIPPQVVTQMTANHERTLKTRDNICANATAGPAAPPPGPRLSDELGVRGIAGQNPAAPRSGTFDTLTGNALSR